MSKVLIQGSFLSGVVQYTAEGVVLTTLVFMPVARSRNPSGNRPSSSNNALAPAWVERFMSNAPQRDASLRSRRGGGGRRHGVNSRTDSTYEPRIETSVPRSCRALTIVSDGNSPNSRL